MRTTHTSLPFTDHALHFVEFDPASCHDHDLLWLPHHSQLQSCGRGHKAEHLAERVVAIHALREFGLRTVPGIGTQRQPVWPQGLFGNISHSTSTALTVVSRQPVGIDVEAIFTSQTATELANSVVTHAGRELLTNSGLPTEQALTLASSAKESTFKTTRTPRQAGAGFTQYQIVMLQRNQMIFHTHHQTYRV